MRPRSAGSSRISKRLLPLLADAAISIASPLKGTAALVAAVTVNCVAGACEADAAGSCGWIAPAACVPLSDELASICAASAATAWAVVAALAPVVSVVLPAASAFTASTAPLSTFDLPVTAVGWGPP